MLKKFVFGLPIALVLFFSLPVARAFAQEATKTNPIDTGDTTWMLISTALVLLMTPGLAFFYGGLVRSRNVLNTMMMSLVAMGLIGVTWCLWGYSLAFDVTPGQDGFGQGIEKFIGGLDWLFLNNVSATEPDPIGYAATIPHQLFMAYQMTFAIIHHYSSVDFWCHCRAN